MKTMLCTDVQRDNKDGKPLYTVKVYDLDTPVNFHSYDCLFHGQGKELDVLIKKACQLPPPKVGGLPQNH